MLLTRKKEKFFNICHQIEGRVIDASVGFDPAKDDLGPILLNLFVRNLLAKVFVRMSSKSLPVTNNKVVYYGQKVL